MAFVDTMVADRFGVTNAPHSIGEIDLRVAQAAHMIEVMLIHTADDDFNLDELHSLMVSTGALLGMIGPHIDAVQRAVAGRAGVAP
ncbi:hypothetical protein [Sphingomonas panni]|uniref:hypothetical protein n=1 Tax=Sphingomonas panni TaxID=237612 RepID=UPI001F5B7C4C|nr:hypothetical protein [Sphingomonas panni]